MLSRLDELGQPKFSPTQNSAPRRGETNRRQNPRAKSACAKSAWLILLAEAQALNFVLLVIDINQ
jgi:hypothetical protein